MKSSFMTFKALGKRRLSGAFGLEGHKARGYSRRKLEQFQLSLRKGGTLRRRYLLNYKRSRHSLRCSRTFTSLLDYFHHAKERRKPKMGVQILHIF